MSKLKRYSKRRSSKNRLSKRKTHRRRHTRRHARRQRGRGNTGSSATNFIDIVNESEYYKNGRADELIRLAIKDNPDLKEMIDEIPKPPQSYSGPSRSQAEMNAFAEALREYRKKRDNLLLSWFKTQKQLGNNNNDYNIIIEYLQQKLT